MMKRLTGITILVLVAAMIILVIAMIGSGRENDGGMTPQGNEYRIVFA